MWDFFRYYIRLWDWRLFLFILLFLGLPNIYQLYRVRLIGNELPDPGSLAIVSQWQFVGLTIEVFQEATVLGDLLLPRFADTQQHGSATRQGEERLHVHLPCFADLLCRRVPVP